MALSHRSSRSSSNAMAKAIILPFLVFMAIAGIGVAEQDEQQQRQVAPVAKLRSRFQETPLDRKLLNVNQCGSGRAPNYSCARLLGPRAAKPTCCTDRFGFRACWDVGASLTTKCGSCTTVCRFGYICCSGVCVNWRTDQNNCGGCGKRCKRNLQCLLGLCNYGHRF